MPRMFKNLRNLPVQFENTHPLIAPLLDRAGFYRSNADPTVFLYAYVRVVGSRRGWVVDHTRRYQGTAQAPDYNEHQWFDWPGLITD